MIGLLQATSVFVSTISITAIALDRRRLIVGSEQESPQDMGKVVSVIPVIWAVAVAMARYAREKKQYLLALLSEMIMDG